MKQGLYRKLAWMGIKNNKQMYIPYFIMGICVITIYYILDALSGKPSVADISTTLTIVLALGMFVILFFSFSYLLYTNSFLIKRRFREFGLYNVLGMDKKNLSKILVWENGIAGGICIAGGLFAGMLLEKFAEVCLLRFADIEVGFEITFRFAPVLRTVVFYAILFVIIMLRSLHAVKKTNPIELVKNDSLGEKPVKANWVLAVLGLVILIVAYCIAVKCDTTMTAISNFFIAVLLVILATDFLFISGSVALCKMLKSWKGYYYKSKHFASVSSMTYRMKRNGVGLSVICVLATMVMVMITGSGCLFFGKEESMKDAYPQNSYVLSRLDDVNKISDEALAEKEKVCEEVLAKNGVNLSTAVSSRYLESDGMLVNGVYSYTDESLSSILDGAERVKYVCSIYVIDEADYNRLTGKNVSLKSGEILINMSEGKYKLPTFEVSGLKTFTVKEELRDFPYIYTRDSWFMSAGIVVSSYNEFAPIVYADADMEGTFPVSAVWYYGWDAPEDSDQMKILSETTNVIKEVIRWDNGGCSCYNGNLADEKNDYYSMYGGLFFLGIMLSVVFIVATVLIIYYKQITEGFEDRKRFEIMQKVGMTKDDIRKSINSQMLTVFFFPPFLAVIHLSFAMPMMFEMLKLFGVYNKPLLIGIAAVCVAVFAVGYIAVYKITSNTYYKIVSGKHA